MSKSDDARELVTRGALLHLDGDVDGARSAYQQALKLVPNHGTALNNLGFLTAQGGALEEGQEAAGARGQGRCGQQHGLGQPGRRARGSGRRPRRR